MIYSLMIGRYQPLHEGHRKLIKTVLAEGKNSTRIQLGLSWVRKYSWNQTAQGTLQAYRAAKNIREG